MTYTGTVTDSIGGSKGGARDSSPAGPNSFIFMQSAKNLQNNPNLVIGATPSGKSWIRHWIIHIFPVFIDVSAGADPGFPVGGAPTLQGKARTYKFSEKLHKIKKIWSVGGASLGSATALSGHTL